MRILFTILLFCFTLNSNAQCYSIDELPDTASFKNFMETLVPIEMSSERQIIKLKHELKRCFKNKKGVTPYSTIIGKHEFFLLGRQFPNLLENFNGFSYQGIGKIFYKGNFYSIYQETYFEQKSVVITKYNQNGCIVDYCRMKIEKGKDFDKAIDTSISFVRKI